jgi:hypothetical protein
MHFPCILKNKGLSLLLILPSLANQRDGYIYKPGLTLVYILE